MHRIAIPLTLAAMALAACTAPAHPWAPQHQSIRGQAGTAPAPAPGGPAHATSAEAQAWAPTPAWCEKMKTARPDLYQQHCE